MAFAACTARELSRLFELLRSGQVVARLPEHDRARHAHLREYTCDFVNAFGRGVGAGRQLAFRFGARPVG